MSVFFVVNIGVFGGIVSVFIHCSLGQLIVLVLSDFVEKCIVCFLLCLRFT